MKTIKISGPQGSGKSVVATAIYHQLRELYDNVRLFDDQTSIASKRQSGDFDFLIYVVQGSNGDSLTITTEDS